MAFVFSTVSVFLVWLIIVATVQSQVLVESQAPVEPQLERLDAWLQDRQLDRLSTRLAETHLARELDAGKRRQLATDLAERYRVQFLSHPSDADSDQFISKAERLIQNYPAVNTPGLELAISHAFYLDAERSFLEWWRDGAKPARRGAILEQLRQVLDRLDRQIKSNNSLQENVIAMLPYDDEENRKRQQQLDEIESRLMHANYLRGWACYFSAVIPIQNDSSLLGQAQAAFYRTLRIEQEESIDQIDSKWLDVSIPLARRALLGLAMVYLAQEQRSAGQFCLSAAEKLDGGIGDRAIWQLNALAYSKQWNAAIKFALTFDSDSNQPELPGSFCQAVVDAGFAGLNFDPRAGNELQRIGLLGLLRNFDSERLKQIVDARRIELSGDRFEDLWIKGLLNYELIAGNQAGLEKINQLLRSSLELAGQDQDPMDVAKVRYLLALVELKQGHPRESIVQLCQIVEAESRFAENAAWLKCRALITIAKSNSRQIGDALAAINDFVVRFPLSRLAPQAEFEQLKLSSSLMPPEDAVNRLATVSTNDSFYNDAQFEIVRAQYRLWSALRDHQGDDDPTANERLQFENLVALDRRYRELPALSPAQQFASLKLVIDASLKRESNRQEIDELLSLAEQIILEAANAGSDHQPQLMYFRFLAAKKFGDSPSASRLAGWLAQNADERTWRLAALAWLAEEADRAGDTPVNELIVNYETLAEQLGTSRREIARSRNSRAAAARLAELYIETNQIEKASPLNDMLLELIPNQEQFILNAARIEMASGDYDSALQHWRKLAAGSEIGSSTWLESKLGLVGCLMRSDPAAAASVLRQTLNLAGELPRQWQEPFETLGAELERSKPKN